MVWSTAGELRGLQGITGFYLKANPDNLPSSNKIYRHFQQRYLNKSVNDRSLLNAFLKKIISFLNKDVSVWISS